MMFREIEVEKNLKERFTYRDMTFPFEVYTDNYHEFVNRTMNCHWHYEFEYGYVLSGELDYYINDTSIKLRKGDCIFVNSHMLHMAKQSVKSQDTVMFTVVFTPSLLTQSINSTIYRKFFQPVISRQLEGVKISSDVAGGDEIIAALKQVYSLDETAFGYELKCLELVSGIWTRTLQYIDSGEGLLLQRTGAMQHSERAKEILSYIHKNYAEKISIDDIIRHVNISRSECFRCFKYIMNQKPMEYINEYRLSKAAKLLQETDQSITEIYLNCGLNSGAYFGKIFKKAYGVTPFQYRKMR